MALLGLAEEAAGVAGEDGDEQQLERPLAAQAQALDGEAGPRCQGWHADDDDAGDPDAEAEARAKPAMMTTVSIQKAYGEPQ